MADFYVDVVNGSSANSGATSALPKQYISEVTMSANNRIFLKRGQVHPISNYRFFLSGQSMDAYGNGPPPILQKSAGSDAWVYIRNADGVSIKNIDIDGNGFGGPVVAVSNTGAGQAVSNFLLENISIYGSSNETGLYIAGTVSGSTVRSGLVKNCVFHSNGRHGTLCSTDVQDVVYIGCVSRNNGDGWHGFSAWSASSSPAPSRITWMFCIAEEMRDTTGIEGQGFQGDDNSSYITAIGCIARNCDGYGFLLNNSANALVTGCIAHDNGSAGFGTVNVSTGARFLNNTAFRNSATRTPSAEISIGGSSTGAEIRNNVMHGDGRTATGIRVEALSSSGSVATHNCVYGVTTEAIGITPTGSVLSDPLLDADYRIRTDSPCYGAGTYIAGARDFSGRKLKRTPDIGARQYYAPRAKVSPSRALAAARNVAASTRSVRTIGRPSI